MNDRFVVPGRLRNTSLFLIAIGLITLVAGVVCLLMGNNDTERARFWLVLLHDSVFFTLITAVSIFIISAVTLAHGAWIVAYRRVPEAIGANVWLFATISGAVMLLIVFCFRDAHGVNSIYQWVTEAEPGKDKILLGKKAF